MSLSALALNCTLKRSPAVSHTQALIDKVLGLIAEQGVATDSLRVVDHHVPFGVRSDEGEGDEWPAILERIRAADILILGMPIWFGVRSSVAQLVIERLDGTYDEIDRATGQFPLYNTVAGCVVTGNEDGAHDCAATTLFNLGHLGCVVPPNADCYWVGTAGPGPSYLDAGGPRHLYTNRTARFLAHNVVEMARIIADRPLTTNLLTLTERAKAESD